MKTYHISDFKIIYAEWQNSRMSIREYYKLNDLKENKFYHITGGESSNMSRKHRLVISYLSTSLRPMEKSASPNAYLSTRQK